jgi:hypothetical protein
MKQCRILCWDWQTGRRSPYSFRQWVHAATMSLSIFLNLSSGGTPPRSLATQIFYLLTHEDPRGVFHMVRQSMLW